MPSPLPYMPLYHRDLLSSSTVAEMPLTAQAIYMRLMMYQWEDESLPIEPSRLMRICGANESEWDTFAPWLDRCFPTCEDGRRRNRRVAVVRVDAEAKVEKNRLNGRKGGRPANPKPPQEKPNENPTVNPEKTQPEPIPDTDTDSTTNVVESEPTVLKDVLDALMEVPAIARSCEHGAKRAEYLAGLQRVMRECERETMRPATMEDWLQVARAIRDQPPKAWLARNSVFQIGPSAALSSRWRIAWSRLLGDRDLAAKLGPRPAQPAPDPQRSEPVEGVDFEMGIVDSGDGFELARVYPATNDPFDENAWRERMRGTA